MMLRQEEHKAASHRRIEDRANNKMALASWRSSKVKDGFLDLFGDPVTNPKCRIGSLGDHLTFVTSGGREVYWFIEFDGKAL